MDMVVINRSNRKVGLILALLGLILLSPLLVYIQYSAELSSNFSRLPLSQISFGIFAFGLIIVAFVYCSLVVLKTLLSKTVALELSEKGIRYNPIGRSEQFIPADEIYGASLERTGDGSFSALLVLKKEGRAEHLDSSVSARILKTAPAMRIWHEFLDGSPESIAHAINQFYDKSKSAEQPEIYELNKTRNAYLPIVVGLVLISIGFVIPFAAFPLWFGFGAALLLITLGSIILSICSDKVNIGDLPKHIIKVIKTGVNTLFSGFTAPIPTVSKRIAGAILYPAVGLPAFYSILSYVICKEMSCEKAYDISADIVLPMFVVLIVVGYGMGIGRKQ